MEILINFGLLIVTAIVFFAAGFFLGRYFLEQLGTTMILEAEERRNIILNEARREADTVRTEKLEEVSEEWKRKKKEFEQEITIKNNKFAQTQKQLQVKEETLTRRTEQTVRREKQLDDQQKDVNQKLQFTQQRSEELKNLIAEQNQKLETISALNTEDAKAMLIDNLTAKAKEEAAVMVKQIHEEAEESAKKVAEKTVVMAIERTSFDQAAENAITVVHLQSDELKGRIIGREGRNIKAFENTTGVDIIVDDTPEVVILSSFDPVRREIAKLALQKLLVDGIIHPAAVEKAVKEAQQGLEEQMMTAGEETVAQLGVTNLHPDLVKLIGKMKFRSSYGQNLLKHSREVSTLAGLMAAEVKLDTRLAKRAGLLHDIGKMLDQPDTSHALAGMELLKKYKEHPVVVNAVGAHHGEIAKESAIADLVDAANVISGSRPGARGAVTPDGYIKRLESLEEIARGFQGVVKSYALQAGREIRVIVEGERISDVQADTLAHDIANKIHTTVQYPGQIKITVVREMRAVAYAK